MNTEEYKAWIKERFGVAPKPYVSYMTGVTVWCYQIKKRDYDEAVKKIGKSKMEKNFLEDFWIINSTTMAYRFLSPLFFDLSYRPRITNGMSAADAQGYRAEISHQLAYPEEDNLTADELKLLKQHKSEVNDFLAECEEF